MPPVGIIHNEAEIGINLVSLGDNTLVDGVSTQTEYLVAILNPHIYNLAQDILF